MPLALIRKSWDRVEPCRRVRHVSTMSAFLADFAYFQSRRTQVAIDRMRESANVVEDAVFEDQHKEGRGVGLDDDSLIKDSLKMFFQSRHYIEDLKKCFVRNETARSFVTSDDPAIITNKFFMQKLGRSNFGLASSGAMLLMPLSPMFILLCYDGGVYTIFSANGAFVGAISTAAPAERMNKRRWHEHVRAVTESANAISRNLGFSNRGNENGAPRKSDHPLNMPLESKGHGRA